jgi:hypothetical protein
LDLDLISPRITRNIQDSFQLSTPVVPQLASFWAQVLYLMQAYWSVLQSFAQERNLGYLFGIFSIFWHVFGHHNAAWQGRPRKNKHRKCHNGY